ncbi:MAG: transporter substrate-binding domain-containing protein [Erysipelotrichaceae bacterium]|nr:transporter substrate-binding domain-containing protein [Erysipelotrichaceae bacterium]
MDRYMTQPLKNRRSIRIRRLLSFVLLLMLAAMPFGVFAEEDVSIKDYNGKPIGVLVGPLMEGLADEYFPDSEHLLLNTYTDCIAALLTDKIKGFLADEPSLKMVCAEQPEISYLPEKLMNNQYSFAFRKNDPESASLCEELNGFIRRCWEDGTMKQIEDTWFGYDEDKKVVDMSKLRNDKRILRVATTSADMPFSYIKDGKNVGYDIDLVTRFCLEKGYGLELVDVDFAGRIPEVESGKCDFSTDMNVTPERQEQVLFSEPTSHGGIVLAVRKADLEGDKDTSNNDTYKSLDELAGKRIGITTGSIHDKLIEKRLPTAKIMYFTGLADLPVALKAKQIDAFVCPESAVIFMHYEDESLIWFDESLTDANLAFAFPKSEEGRKLNERFDEYLGRLIADKTIDKLKEKWFAADEENKSLIDYAALKDINGTLHVATAAQQMPYCYVRDDLVVGLEIEIIANFCQENGYGLEVDKMNFDGVLASLQSGKADLAASCLAVTEERKQSVDFSRSYSSQSVVLVIEDEKVSAKTGFISSIFNSFYKTFIREDRYRLFLEGIGTTMFITLLSVLFGTILGFLLFIVCRNGNVLPNRITGVCIFLVQGMPMVVLLMVLYYIIFGSVAISGISVAVLGFSATFGASVFGLIKMAVGTIERGQYEAAYALGHSNRQTFYRIILPQALPHVMPAYRGEIVSLIKATAIVGYIAVQDLTKMGDIVRSRTYEAFFPLIAITIIYFVLEGLLGLLVSRISMNIDPKNRKAPDLLKGVKIHD